MIRSQTKIKVMKYLIEILICSLFILVGKTVIIAQECPKPPFETKINVEKITSRKAEEYKDWREIKSKYITFYAPNDLKELKVNCYEGACASFDSKDIHMGIDTNSAAFYPYYEKTFPTYIEKLFWIDGRLAWFWSFKSDEGNIYKAGIFFYFEENPKRRLVINFNSTNKDVNSIAERIVKSIELAKSK